MLKPEPQALAWLAQNGHALVGGGRGIGVSREFGHSGLREE